MLALIPIEEHALMTTKETETDENKNGAVHFYTMTFLELMIGGRKRQTDKENLEHVDFWGLDAAKFRDTCLNHAWLLRTLLILSCGRPTVVTDGWLAAQSILIQLTGIKDKQHTIGS